MQSSGHFWKNFSNNYLLCTHCHNVSLSCFHILAPNDKRALNCWNKHIMNSVLNPSLFQESSPTPRAVRWSSTTPGRTSSSTSPTPARRRSPQQAGESSPWLWHHSFRPSGRETSSRLGQSQNVNLFLMFNVSQCHIITINVNVKTVRQVWKVF